MRIIAGTARGRRLKMPKSGQVRPTADRVKESLFNQLGQWLDGQGVLDLFAGSGNLGLEALSRGAAHVTFVEIDRKVMPALAENVHALGFDAASSLLLRSADRALTHLAGQGASFDLVLADPPYGKKLAGRLLEQLGKLDLVHADGRAVIEHERHEVLPDTSGKLARIDQRRFGETVLSWYALA